MATRNLLVDSFKSTKAPNKWVSRQKKKKKKNRHEKNKLRKEVE